MCRRLSRAPTVLASLYEAACDVCAKTGSTPFPSLSHVIDAAKLFPGRWTHLAQPVLDRLEVLSAVIVKFDEARQQLEQLQVRLYSSAPGDFLQAVRPSP